MSKLIGVTPRLLTEGTVVKQFVNCDYIEALTKLGFNCIMLTVNNPELNNVLALCDGFLVTGGSDIDPIHFNETNELGLSKGIHPSLDEIDKKVVAYAKEHKVPMLGICRGHQTINVFLGGTLYQDIGTSHSSTPSEHEVITISNDVLKFDKEIKVNSYHHQAVKDPAPGMEVIARHKDGTIEAMIHNQLPIICVQWHPERLQGTAPSNIIFNKFSELVNRR